MALISCSECNKDISEKASSCPHCGCPLSDSQVSIPGEREQISCPICGSNQISSGTKGFGLGKAALGGLALGPVGLLAGAHKSKKITLNCMHCGHNWSPESLLDKEKRSIADLDDSLPDHVFAKELASLMGTSTGSMTNHNIGECVEKYKAKTGVSSSTAHTILALYSIVGNNYTGPTDIYDQVDVSLSNDEFAAELVQKLEAQSFDESTLWAMEVLMVRKYWEKTGGEPDEVRKFLEGKYSPKLNERIAPIREELKKKTSSGCAIFLIAFPLLSFLVGL